MHTLQKLNWMGLTVGADDVKFEIVIFFHSYMKSSFHPRELFQLQANRSNAQPQLDLTFFCHNRQNSRSFHFSLSVLCILPSPLSYKQFVLILFEYSFHTMQPTAETITDFAEALMMCDLPRAAEIMEENLHTSLIDEALPTGVKPIHYCAILGNPALIEYLITVGAQIDFQCLEYAAKNHNVDTLRVLMIHSDKSVLALAPAAAFKAPFANSMECLKVLLDAGGGDTKHEVKNSGTSGDGGTSLGDSSKTKKVEKVRYTFKVCPISRMPLQWGKRMTFDELGVSITHNLDEVLEGDKRVGKPKSLADITRVTIRRPEPTPPRRWEAAHKESLNHIPGSFNDASVEVTRGNKCNMPMEIPSVTSSANAFGNGNGRTMEPGSSAPLDIPTSRGMSCCPCPPPSKPVEGCTHSFSSSIPAYSTKSSNVSEMECRSDDFRPKVPDDDLFRQPRDERCQAVPSQYWNPSPNYPLPVNEFALERKDLQAMLKFLQDFSKPTDVCDNPWTVGSPVKSFFRPGSSD